MGSLHYVCQWWFQPSLRVPSSHILATFSKYQLYHRQLQACSTFAFHLSTYLRISYCHRVAYITKLRTSHVTIPVSHSSSHLALSLQGIKPVWIYYGSRCARCGSSGERSSEMDDLSDVEEVLGAADCCAAASSAAEGGDAGAADFPGPAPCVDAPSSASGSFEALDHPHPQPPHSPLLSDASSHHGALDELSDDAACAVVPDASIRMRRRPRPKFERKPSLAKYLPGRVNSARRREMRRRFRRVAAAHCKVANTSRRQMKAMSEAGSVAFDRHELHTASCSHIPAASTLRFHLRLGTRAG